MLETSLTSTSSTSSKPALAQWVYESLVTAIDPEIKLKLRARLRGNQLHILCESSQVTDEKVMVDHLVRSMRLHKENLNLLKGNYQHPIYQVILYGRAVQHREPDWIKPIIIGNIHHFSDEESAPKEESPKNLLISNKTLAKSGSPEAIARYLSDCLSHLGISIRVIVQNLTDITIADTRDMAQKRLWVICTSDYSPESDVLVQPIAQELRDLELQGFKEAVIRAEVIGESVADWIIRVDLTHPEVLLKEWAQWGDIPSLIALLNRKIGDQGFYAEIKGILKESTLHLFCAPLPSHPDEIPEQNSIVSTLKIFVGTLSPQGIKSATIYGLDRPAHEDFFENYYYLNQHPVWVDWLNLPASHVAELAKTPELLAQEGNRDALLYLLQKKLNPNLENRLQTGGIKVKLCQKEDILHIMTEAVNCPEKQSTFSDIEQFFQYLQPAGLSGIRVYGRISGETAPKWAIGLDFLQKEAQTKENYDFAPSSSPLPDLSELVSDVIEEEEEEDQVSVDRLTLKSILSTISQGLREGVIRSKLFIPYDNHHPHFVSSTTTLPQQQNVAITCVWGLLGLLLTIQADWVTGQFFQLNTTEKTSPTLQNSTTKTVKSQDVEIPNLSLKKSEGDSPLNGSSFTDTQNVSFVSSDLESQKQASVTAILATARQQNPSFNNRLLDDKYALYQQHILERGKPSDIIIVGSSRAMRGIDPKVLKKALVAQGYPDADIFNFGINGATAQTVEFLLKEVLTPEQLPKMVIFADGARAFNSGREDLTYSAMVRSDGYEQLKLGTFPRLTQKQNQVNGGLSSQVTTTITPKNLTELVKQTDNLLNQTLGKFSLLYSNRQVLKTTLSQNWRPKVMPSPNGNNSASDSTVDTAVTVDENSIDLEGFLPLKVKFDPETYYKKHPYVLGLYDGDYRSFSLQGIQDTAFINTLNYLQEKNISLVMVNIPLTDRYLDQYRMNAERQFTQYMREMSQKYDFTFRDMASSKAWQKQYKFYSDPSHLNRFGAVQVAQQLAQDSMITWIIP